MRAPQRMYEARAGAQGLRCGVASDLSSLRSEVADALSAGPDLRLEHEVEREGIGERVSLRGEDGVSLEALLELLGVHGAGVALDALELGARLLAQAGLLVRQRALAVLLQKFVRAVGHVLLRGGHHEIGETGNVTRRPEKGENENRQAGTNVSGQIRTQCAQPSQCPSLLFTLCAARCALH